MSVALSVALVTHESARDLPACLASLAAAAERPTSVVIVDNASAAPPPEASVRNAANRGYGAALNQALALIDTEFVVLANPDVVFAPGSLDRMVRFLEAHPEHALAGPDGTARSFPTVGLEACELFLGHRLWPGNPVHGRFFRADLAGRTGDCDWLVGACLVARRAALAAVGGFDENYFMYFEETDLAWRLARAGWRCAQVGDARVAHAGGGSSRGRELELERTYLRSQQRFFVRKSGAPAAALLRAVQVLGQTFRLAVWGGRALVAPESSTHLTPARARARRQLAWLISQPSE